MCAGPGPSVIKRPSCAVTSDTEAGVIRDPRADLDRAAEGEATPGISMKDDGAVPFRLPAGATSGPANVQDGPLISRVRQEQQRRRPRPPTVSSVSAQKTLRK